MSIEDSQSTLCWDTVVNWLDRKEIDFLFIDGDHLYESVKKDFELYSTLVRKGGIIAFHDVHIRDNPTVVVYKFWEEIEKKYPNYQWKVGFDKNLDGIDSQGTGTGILYL